MPDFNNPAIGYHESCGCTILQTTEPQLPLEQTMGPSHTLTHGHWLFMAWFFRTDSIFLWTLMILWPIQQTFQPHASTASLAHHHEHDTPFPCMRFGSSAQLPSSSSPLCVSAEAVTFTPVLLLHGHSLFLPQPRRPWGAGREVRAAPPADCSSGRAPRAAAAAQTRGGHKGHGARVPAPGAPAARAPAARPAPAALPPRAPAVCFALPPRVPMALKRIQKVSGAELWEGAERASCSGVVAGVPPLLPGVEAAAGPGSARGVAAAAAAHFLYQDSSFPHWEPGKRSGCKEEKGWLLSAASRFRGCTSLKAPHLESVPEGGQCLWSSRDAPCGSGGSRGADGECSAEAQGQHLSPQRCAAVVYGWSALCSGEVKKCCQHSSWCDLWAYPSYSVWGWYLQMAWFKLWIPNFLLFGKAEAIAEPYKQREGGVKVSPLAVEQNPWCLVAVGVPYLGGIGTVISCAGFPFAVESHWHCRNRIL